jgi:hypothetical protein
MAAPQSPAAQLISGTGMEQIQQDPIFTSDHLYVVAYLICRGQATGSADLISILEYPRVVRRCSWVHG